MDTVRLQCGTTARDHRSDRIDLPPHGTRFRGMCGIAGLFIVTSSGNALYITGRVCASTNTPRESWSRACSAPCLRHVPAVNVAVYRFTDSSPRVWSRVCKPRDVFLRFSFDFPVAMAHDDCSGHDARTRRRLPTHRCLGPLLFASLIQPDAMLMFTHGECSTTKRGVDRVEGTCA